MCKTAKTSVEVRHQPALQLTGSTQTVRKISHCCGNPVICCDTHHYIHRLSSVFVLDNHGVSARVLQRNAFDGQTGEPALVQRHHVLEHERSDVSEALHSNGAMISPLALLLPCCLHTHSPPSPLCKSGPNIYSGFFDLCWIGRIQMTPRTL